MDNCRYKTVDTKRKQSRQPFLRQLMICSGVWNLYFMSGMVMGASTVIIPQLRREANSIDAVSPAMASWLSSIQYYGGLPWVFILPALARWIGRKYTIYVMTICNLICFFVLFFSRTAEHILVALVIMGPSTSSLSTISPILITEYTSPMYRGVFLTVKSATVHWGIWVSNSLGTFLHWRSIAITGLVCVMYNILTTHFWCESPYWLASKERYEDCARSHRWLKGTGDDAEKELLDLTMSFKEQQEEHSLKTCRRGNIIRTSLQAMLKRRFYKPFLLSAAVMTLYHATGKLAINVYAIDVIKEITSDEHTAYIGMLVLDGIAVIGMYCGCCVAKVLKRRIFLFSTTCAGITFLLMLSTYCWLIEYSIMGKNKYVSLILLMLFMLSVSSGPLLLSTSIYAELIPQSFKTLSMIATGLYITLLFANVLKIAPLLFQTFGLHGSFLFFAISSTVFLCILYLYLPETKDKTLQEIERQLLT